MNEVVGDLDVPRGAGKALLVADVADVKLEAGSLESRGLGGVADQAADRRPRGGQRGGEPATDEPRGSSDETPSSDLPKLPGVRVHLLERSQWVPVTVEQAFAFYADERNLEPLTPPWLHFEVTSPRPIAMAAGTLLEYRLKLHGVPIRWRTRIETWEPPRRFVDFQEKGPYSLWEHTHLFEAGGDGTVIHDRVRYAIPLGPLGTIAHGLFVRRDLERIFDFRRDAVAARIGAV